MRVSIVGSRKFPRLDLVREYVRALNPGTVVVSGTEPVPKDGDLQYGVDRTAIHEARKCGLPTKVWEADWSKGRGAGMMRNTDIVMDGNVCVAFYDGESRGTKDSIKKANTFLRPVYVVEADAIDDQTLDKLIEWTAKNTQYPLL